MWAELKKEAEQAVEWKRLADKAAEEGDIDSSLMWDALATRGANKVIYRMKAAEDDFQRQSREMLDRNLPVSVMMMNERSMLHSMMKPVREILIAGGFDADWFTMSKLGLARANAMLQAANAKVHLYDVRFGSDGPRIESVPVPPSTAKLALLMLLPPKHRDAVVGDLIEDYPRKVEEYGRRGADRWFWRQAAISIALLVGNRLTTMAGIAAAVDFLRRITR